MLEKGWSSEQQAQTKHYLNFLAERSKGNIKTGAKFLREFVHSHPGYKKDSILSREIIFDLSVMVASLEDPKSDARTILLGAYASTGN